MRLLDFFAPVITKILSLRAEMAASATGAPARSSDSVFAELRSDLGSALQQAVRAGGHQEKDVDLARKAIVAWADEHLTPPGTIAWMGATPKLQKSFYQSEKFGDQFFDFLKDVTPDKPQIAEVFVTVLGLGFRGRMHGRQFDREIFELRRELSLKLDPQPVLIDELRADPATSVYFAPQPYGVADPPAREYQTWNKWLLAAVAASLLLALAIGGLLYAIRGPAQPDYDAIRAKIAAETTKLSCAAVTFTLSPAEPLNVVFDGRAPSGESLDRLEASVSTIVEGELGGPANVAFDRRSVEIVPQPFCQMRDLLDDAGVISSAGPGLPSIATNASGSRFRSGDLIEITIDNARTAGHFLVAYMNVRGDILQLMPRPLRSETVAAPTERIVFGVTNRAAATRANPPMTVSVEDGYDPVQQGMIVAIKAPRPLLGGDQTPAAEVEAYVASLRRALEAAVADGVPISDLLGQYHMIEIR